MAAEAGSGNADPDALGATSLVKRLWTVACLEPWHGFERWDWHMPDTRSIALGLPFAAGGGEEDGGEDEQRYFAVLALDGDQMGQWVSGTHNNMPRLKTQISSGALAYMQKKHEDVVREAQRAEKRAKRDLKAGGLGRSAVAVTLMKRSGETIEWGCKWDGGGLEAFSGMLDAVARKRVSAKFPHRIVELVDGYRVSGGEAMGGTACAEGFEAVVDDVLMRDVALGGHLSPVLTRTTAGPVRFISKWRDWRAGMCHPRSSSVACPREKVPRSASWKSRDGDRSLCL